MAEFKVYLEQILKWRSFKKVKNAISRLMLGYRNLKNGALLKWQILKLVSAHSK